ncbi:MAG: YceI family protein [Candidatus Hydrogenedentales bacterium]
MPARHGRCLREGEAIMTTRTLSRSALGALALGLLVISPIAAAAQDAPPALKLTAARVSIAGTSNIHPFTASTTDVRMSRLVLAPADGDDRLQAAAKAGGVEAFQIAIRAASLTSPKEGLDKNMHKALKVNEHQDITFRLIRLEPAAAANSLKAVGTLKIAGVEKEVAVPLKVGVNASTITAIGEVTLMMTDYGITPPKAMLGMLKTDPKITITFEIVLALPLVTTF